MFNINNKVKQFLLTNNDITDLVSNNIYNIVVVTSDNKPVKAPYLVIEINKLQPYKTKDHFVYYNLNFSVIILASKYNDLTTISEVVKNTLDLKDIDENIQSVQFDSYNESFDSEFELYVSRLSFNSTVYNN